MADDITITVRVRDLTRGGAGSVRSSLDGIAAGAARIGAGSGGILFLATSLQQLAGIALIVPGAMSVAAAAVATFKIALSGISEALTATSSGSAGAGQNMAAFGRQVRDANRSIEDAQRGVEAANRGLADAERSAQDAERQVGSAKRDVARASRDYQRALDDEQAALAAVDDARQDAIRTLADLAEAQDDSTRSVHGAEIALKRAQQAQLAANKDVKATALDREEAAYRVEEAEDRLSDSQLAAADASTKYAAAQAKGVEGSDAVRAAQDAVAAAHERTEAAAEGVISANEGLDAAYRGVEDAQRGVEDAQRGVDDANRGVEDAVQRLNDLYAEHAEQAKAAAGGADAYADALSKISPEARELVKMLRSLSDEWQDVQFAVQDAAFDGVAEDVRDLAGTYLPLLKSGLSDIAGEFNDMEGHAFDALMDPDVIQSVNDILDDTAGFLDGADTALGDFLAGFLQLASIGSGFLPEAGKWIADIAKEFREWVETNPDEARQFIQDALDGFGDLWDTISNVIDIVGALFDGLAGGADDGGETFLQMLSDMTGDLLAFVESDAVQNFLGFLGAVAKAIFDTIPIWGPVAAGIAIVSVAMGILNAVLDANPIALVVIGIGLLVAGFIYLWNNVEGFRNFWIGVWDWIVTRFTDAKNGISDGFTWLWDKIKTIGDWIGGVVDGMFDGLAGAAKTAVNAAIVPLNGLIDGLNWVIDGLNDVNPFAPIPHVPHVGYLAHGGIASGMAVVGEHGPELVDLPAGSRVHPAGDSARMLADDSGGGGRGGALELRVAPGADSALASLLMRMVRTGELQLVQA